VKAAWFRGPELPLIVDEAQTPSCGEHDVLVRVAACGVCHTDLHYIDHGTPTFKKPPLILGHEIAGTVVETGAQVKRPRVGAHVLLPAVLPCGSCTACRSGRENICEEGVMLGNHVNGGYAEHIAIAARHVFPLPEEIPLVEGSIIADALTTPFHAVVRRGQVQPGDWVLVVGCGGIGANIVQIAAALGAQVIAIDKSSGKLDWARRLGAAVGLNPEEHPRRSGGARGERRGRAGGIRSRRTRLHAGAGALLPAYGWPPRAGRLQP
jgi:6-hydroxycyclohex-1-ene-1-carbonyl-CoA dehydrogenase